MAEKIIFGHTWKSFSYNNPNHVNNLNDWKVKILEIYINLADFPQATPDHEYMKNIFDMQDGMWCWDNYSKRWWSGPVNEKVKDAFTYCKNNGVTPLVCFGHNEEQSSWISRSPSENTCLWLEKMAEEFAKYIKLTYGFARADDVIWNEANECQSASVHANVTYHINRGWKKVYPNSWTHGFNSNLREQNFLNDCLAIPMFVQSIDAVSFHILTDDEWDSNLIAGAYNKVTAKGKKVTWLEVSPLGDMERLDKLLGKGEMVCCVLLIRNSLIGQGEGITITDLLIYYFDRPNTFESVNGPKIEWLKNWTAANTKEVNVNVPIPPIPPVTTPWLDPNTKLTDDFRWGEFWSNNFGKPKVEPPKEYYPNIFKVAVELQKVRTILKVPITITSGWRTVAWNSSKSVEGASGSKHLTGECADSKASGISTVKYFAYICRYTNLNHLGCYIANGFVHAGIADNFTVFRAS